MIFHSSIEPIYFLLPIVGFIVGLFGTMLGGGGGFFFLPTLTLLIGSTTQTAVITSLVATLPIGIVGSIGHYKKQNIHFKIGVLFASAGLVGAFIGAGITSLISPQQLKISFGIYSIFIAFHMALRTWQKQNLSTKAPESTENISLFKKTKGASFGLFAGLITGTFGTSGTAPILAGLFTMPLSLKLVIGTSLMIVLTNTIFAIGAHFLVGQIDLTLVYFLTSGSVVGALLGPKILSKTNTENSENKIKYVYALVMVGIGVLMMVG